MGSCIDCLENCGGKSTSDQCVQYTGDDIPLLGVCSGDQLSKLEAAIVNALLSALDGTGISVSGVNMQTCAWLNQQFASTNPTLVNFLQLFVNSTCSLYTMIQQLNALVGQGATYTTSCLSGLPANPTSAQVLSALTADYCNIVKPFLASIPTTYVLKSDLQNQVEAILTSLGLTTTSSTTVTYAQYIPIGAVLPYFGSAANFDNTGAGLPAFGLGGMFMCNGQNGTPDFRGRTLIGAINGIPGGSLDSAVDPTKPFNPNTNFSMGDKTGEYYHTLLTSEIPSHNHAINDPGHTHTVSVPLDSKGGSAGTPVLSSAVNPGHGNTTLTTNLSFTGITLSSTGGGSFHNNIQPSVAVIWIIRLK